MCSCVFLSILRILVLRLSGLLQLLSPSPNTQILSHTMALDSIMTRYGGRVENDLNLILNHVDDDDPQDLISYPHTKYVYTDGLQAHLCSYDDFIILSINIQCLNAKYNELVLLINEICSNNNNLSAICIQETWLGDNDDTSPFNLDGFKLITQGKKCSEHGGLAVYLRNIYEHRIKTFEVTCTSWEFQSIEIYGGDLDHQITMCNIYRPPKTGVNRVITAFKAEFEKLVTLLSKCPPPCAVTGDFNLNLLKINERPVISDFFGHDGK